MKLLSSFLISAFGFQVPPASNTNNLEICFAKDVDIDGNLFGRNVVQKFEDIYSAQECQRHCQNHRAAGCQYFVWEANDFDCALYTGLSGLEYDQDDQGKVMGPVDGCLPCHRDGWDYIVDRAPGNNLVGNGRIAGVSNIFKCAQVCKYSNDCSYVSFDKTNLKCYLKTSEARQADAAYDENYQTSGKGCANSNCVVENRNYQNRWFKRYDIITRKASGGIPGVPNPTMCQRLCQEVAECGFWTWDKDDNTCYIVKEATYLEASDDKISGDRNCIPRADGHQNLMGLQSLDQFSN